MSDNGTVSGSGTVSLEASRRACRELTRTRARNFYFGLCLTPEPRRSALYAIYAWMREADDIADQRGAWDDRGALERWAKLTDEVLDRRDHPSRSGAARVLPHDPHRAWLWPAFADAVGRYPIERDWLRMMLDGLRSDLGGVEHEARAQLDEYCDRVASTVGLCCVAIWGLAPGADSEDARRLAIAQGRAFQLTNILRDLGEDLGQQPRRSYLPRESYRAHGLTPEALAAWSEPERCAGFVRAWVGEAMPGYAAADRLNAILAPDCRAVHSVMTRIYRGVLGRIECDPRVVVGPRPASLPLIAKVGVALRGAIGARLGGRV